MAIESYKLTFGMPKTKQLRRNYEQYDYRKQREKIASAKVHLVGDYLRKKTEKIQGEEKQDDQNCVYPRSHHVYTI